MASPALILGLLFALCLSLGSALGSWFQGWSGGRNQSANVLNALIGDSRRMFANHFFAKADAYFHSGYYPTIFDSQKREEESHLAGGHEPAGEEGELHQHDENCKHDESDEPGHQHDASCNHDDSEEASFLGKPKDWIDRFSRNFYPVHHSHLEKGGERELLPWLRVSAELDPQRVETYTIAAYWLRSRLGKVKEAEQFLREGLRANPGSCEIYFELGRIHAEDLKEPAMARNLWEIALRKWAAQEKAGEKPDGFVFQEITGNLAKLALNENDFEQAIYYLKFLKQKSPTPDRIEAQIQELELKLKK